MGEGSCSEEDCLDLLNQFEHVLESDPLIDEVGFIHPSQFTMLDKEAGLSNTYQNELQSNNETSRSFWNQDHKLGISTDILIQLCKAAKRVFLAAFEEYKSLSNSCNKSRDKNITSGVSCFFHTSETEVMKHSQAVLLLSSDFGTAWNARKLILSNKDQPCAFMEELRLSKLVLSNFPKSEPTWSHRRWIIKMIAQRFYAPEEIVTKESDLVETIGERSKMNYRAWYHRCWLVSYMTTDQVQQELNKTKRWAGLHVADSSCFHYRRRLLLKVLETLNVKTSNAYDKTEAHKIWKEELEWNKELVEAYVGREALWFHRRYLSLTWIMHLADNHSDTPFNTGQSIIISEEIVVFFDNEIHLVESSMIVPDTNFEDFEAQALHAAVYMLWLTKHIPELWRMLEEKLGREKLKGVLSRVEQERPFLLHHLTSSVRYPNTDEPMETSLSQCCNILNLDSRRTSSFILRFGDEQSSLMDRFERLSFEAQLNKAMFGRSRSESSASLMHSAVDALQRTEAQALAQAQSLAQALAPAQVQAQVSQGRGGSSLNKILKTMLKPITYCSRRMKRGRSLKQYKFDPHNLRHWKTFSRSARFF